MPSFSPNPGRLNVELGALTRTGQRRHARYHLAIPLRPTPRISIDKAAKIVEPPEA